MRLKPSTWTCLFVMTTLTALLVGCQPQGTDSDSGSEGTPGGSTETEAGETATSETDDEEATGMSVVEADYGKTAGGEAVTEYTCTNANGLSMKLITYGAIMTSFDCPDKNGKMANVTLSCPDMAGWEACGSYFGATVGRYCNRIAKGQFELDGKTFTLATNNGENHLHGGDKGFDKVIWAAEVVETDDAVGVAFTYTSPDGEEGYPGELSVKATYLLNNQDELSIEFEATTDQATPVNLTNHNYWNLAGEGSGPVLEQELKLNSSFYLEVNEGLIPTGNLLEVENTPFDFVDFHKIGERIEQAGGDPIGYDHCYVIDRGEAEGMVTAAVVRDPASGRIMEISTTQPGIQFYSGNFLDGTAGSGGFEQYNAFCLETQHYPDSPNQEKFPTTILKPGETYSQKTVHKFSVEK